MEVSNLTIGQQKFLLESLTNQKGPMTPLEKRKLNKLRDLFAEECVVDGDKNFKRVGGFVKMVNMDTFGDNYKNNWIKVRRTDKGEYITMLYTGNKRMYLN